MRSGDLTKKQMSSVPWPHLRPGAIAAGVKIEDGQRFALPNLRHSLSNWAEVQPKCVQAILRHSRVEFTWGLYTQEDSDEIRVA